MGLAAFDLRQSESFGEAKANRPLQGEQWDTGAALAPDGYHVNHDDTESLVARALAGAPTSARLTGKVAVGIIIVQGPTADLKFSAAEQTKVVAEVQNGLGWLGSYSTPAGVSWHYDIHVVSLTTTPGPSSLTLEQKETRWRDPAMAKLGYASGMAGVQKYVEDLRTKKGTDWAYCAFFTKYPVGWFAYASIGGPRLVMDYNNDGWGPDNIDRVFAHETGHIFGAPDEYASSGCSCGGSWGFYGRPNGNCANCAPNGGVPCIMKTNDWTMCSFTPAHLGFPQEQRYSGVFVPGSGNYGLWVDASWPNFVDKWNQWASQGLRLVDLKITTVNGQQRFSGVWQQGSGGYGLWVNADWTSFVNKWKEWSDQGLRLVDIEITNVNGQLRYSGVYQQGTGAYGLWVNTDWTSFVNKWKEWGQKGLRLVDLKIVEVNGQHRYSGVWREGNDGYGLWVNADWTSFVNKWKEWGQQGLRLQDFEITNVGGQQRYSGVWRQGVGGYGLWVNGDWASFMDRWKTWSGEGLRLLDFEIVPPGAIAGAPMVGVEVEGRGMLTGYGERFTEETASSPEGAGFGESYLGETYAGDTGIGFGERFLAEEAAATGMGLGAGSPAFAFDDGSAAGFGSASVSLGAARQVTTDAGFGEFVGSNRDELGIGGRSPF
jgi:hypothetical protein